MDLSVVSIAELKSLLDLIPKELKRREQSEKSKLRKEIEELAAKAGFSLNDLLAEAEAKTKTRKPVAIKYTHPQNASLTWTGRGRQPRWVVEFIEAGGSLDQIAI